MGYSFSYKFMDWGIFEFLGPTGLAVLSIFVGSNLHRFYTGSIYHVTLTILNGITVLLILRQFFLIIALLKIYWFDYNLLLLIIVSLLFLTSYSKGAAIFK
jgi:hypothetical protein